MFVTFKMLSNLTGTDYSGIKNDPHSHFILQVQLSLILNYY